MDRLRVVTLPSTNTRGATIVDLADGSLLAPVRDSFTVTAPQNQAITAQPLGRWGGGRVVSDHWDNGSVAVRLFVKGLTTADDTIQLISQLLSKIDPSAYTVGDPLYLEWRPDGGTRSTYYEIRGTPAWEPGYSWVKFIQTRSMEIGLTFPVAPLARGDSMDFWDDFSANGLSDYSFDAGVSGNVSVGGGQLVPVTNLTTENRFFNVRTYTHPDGQYTLKGAPGATITGFKLGSYFKVTGNTYLLAYLDDNGTNSRVRIDKVVGGGAPTNLASTNLAARVVAGTPIWVRARIEGNTVYIEHFSSEPALTQTAGSSYAPTTSATYVLTASEALSFGTSIKGTAGVVWTPQHANAYIDDYWVEPYVFTIRPGPTDGLDLYGIPGDAPALCDLIVDTGSGVTGGSHTWALMGWNQLPPKYNMLYNGDFENNIGPALTDPWSVAAVTNIVGAGTSLSQQGTPAAGIKFGLYALEVVTPATTGTGVNARISRGFRKGQIYTAEAWIYSAAQVTGMSIRIGNSAANDVATSGVTALSPTWQRISVQWTPTADRDAAHIAIFTNAATATTFRIDGVSVYEGATAPTRPTQIEGRGGWPPIGVLEGEGARSPAQFSWAVPQTSQMTIVADASSRSSQVIRGTATGNGCSASWIVDPTLLVPDSFSDEIGLEVWASTVIASGNGTVRAIASATPISNVWSLGQTDILAPIRYTDEWGAAGKLLPNGGSSTRGLSRLGTLRLLADPLRGPRYQLAVVLKATAGTVDLDYLFLVPVEQRAGSTSGKTYPTLGGYPSFNVNSSGAERKRIRWDLTGRSSDGTLSNLAEIPSAGWGGSPLEFGPGDVRAVFIGGYPGSIPDDPAPTGGWQAVGNPSANSFHFQITPRYRLARGV